MRLWSIVLLALTMGVGLGFAGTVVEFGLVTPPPALNATKPRTALRPQLSPPAPGEPTPKVVVDNATLDFGVMGEGGTGVHKFVFTNEGEGPLQLKVGDPPCKCTVGELSKSVVPPGESAEVEIKYEPGNMHGIFNRTVPIHTNDPHVAGGVIQLRITGRVVALLNVNPPQFLAYGVTPGQSQELTATLHAFKHADLRIEGHRFSDESIAEYFEASYEPLPVEEAGDPLVVAAYRVYLKILPGLPRGRFSQRLILETNEPDQPETTIDIIGNVTELISIAGAGFDPETHVLTFGTIAQGEQAQRQLSVLVRDEKLEDVQVTVESVHPPSLKVEVGEVAEMGGGRLRRLPLTVTVPRNAEAASLFGIRPEEMGKIQLTTNHPEQPQIVIHVRLIVEG